MYPFIELFGLALPTYGLMLVAGVAACVLVALRRCGHGAEQACTRDEAAIVMACMGGMAILGAKLLYILLTFTPGELLELVRGRQFAAVLEGGQVFYGGLIGGAAGALLGFRVAGLSAERANGCVWAILPGVPLGHALGRIGCFLAGCCYGIPYKGALAVVYTHAVGGAPSGVSLFPVQCLEALCNVMIFFALVRAGKKTSSAVRLIMVYAGLYAAARFGIEYLRYDSVRGAALFLSTSQWISVGIVLTMVVFQCVWGGKKRRA